VGMKIPVIWPDTSLYVEDKSRDARRSRPPRRRDGFRDRKGSPPPHRSRRRG
jgi:hypothetical protein